MRNTLSIILMVISFGHLISQSSVYEVELTPIVIPELGGIQSYSVGTHNGEWLILGGRLDGLHERQPFASFSADGNNHEMIVVNPMTKKVWKKSVNTLPTQIKEQLSSTNMQFYQVGEKLITTGGYGYSPSVGDHITYPFLTVIDIPNVINDIKNGDISSGDFHQIENELFRVAGGRLNKIDDIYYLVGGHKFMGKYNPMGSDHGPGFVQEYTNEIRKFELTFNNEFNLNVLSPVHDELHLHRRDYNLVPTVKNGDFGLMAFSGVFQNSADLPWLYPIYIGSDTYEPLEDFSQYFNHYHCATLPIYNESSEEMNTLFFGGIAQFYMDGDLLVQDNDVPFVNTIANIKLSREGILSETVLDASMPGYLGAGSEFILSDEQNQFGQGILSGESVGDEFKLVGYIYGGIRSTLPNIFWINTGEESNASNTIYQVALRKTHITTSNQAVDSEQRLFFYPNPAQKFIRMGIELDEVDDIHLDIFNTEGIKIHTQELSKNEVKKGYNQLVLDEVNIGYGAFIYKVTIGNKIITRKVIWSE